MRELIGAFLFAVVLVGTMVGATVAFTPTDAEREQMAREKEAQARRWADRIGLRVVGVTCDGYLDCTINPDNGAPFRARCGGIKDLCELKKCE